jgi:hypothetical protein
MAAGCTEQKPGISIGPTRRECKQDKPPSAKIQEESRAAVTFSAQQSG